MRLACIVVMCASFAAAALADKIALKDGRAYEGKIVEETEEEVTIRTVATTLVVPREDIESIEKCPSIVDGREERLEALDPSNPPGYLEAAKWMAGDGSEVADEGMMKKLCNVASQLDGALAAEAQLLLGRWLLAKGNQEDAVTAFKRVCKADPGNADALAELKALSTESDEVAKKQLKKLDEALDLVHKTKYKEAVIALRKCEKYAFADKAEKYLSMTLMKFADDIQSRLRCEKCAGKMRAACTPCKGTGLISCQTCKGTGVKKGATGPIEKTGCKSCYTAGNDLCFTCEAKRTVTIYFNKELNGSATMQVTLTGGVEKVGYSKIFKQNTWVREADGAKVTAFKYGPVTGGTRTCPECKGVPYNPSKSNINMEGVTVYRDQIQKRISGEIGLDDVGAVEKVYDEEAVADGKFKYSRGMWRKEGE